MIADYNVYEMEQENHSQPVPYSCGCWASNGDGRKVFRIYKGSTVPPWVHVIGEIYYFYKG